VNVDSPSLGDRIRQIQATLPPSVRLIAVSKTVSVDKIREAYAAGLREFAENRVQEALSKQEALKDLPDLIWHLIGPLQSNKVRKAIEHFDWIHSVDSLKLAERMAAVAVELGRSPQVCLQVKLREDPHKIGWSVAALQQDLPQLAALPALSLCGLMSIPPLNTDPEEILKIFQETRDLAKNLSEESSLCFRELSLGMSGDYRLAIEAGTTMIRLGSILFGDRS
jgi:pyridoxal phosphate enzyme (YggS family)